MRYKCDRLKVVGGHTKVFRSLDDVQDVLEGEEYDDIVFSKDLFFEFFDLLIVGSQELQANGMKLLANLDLYKNPFLLDITFITRVLDLTREFAFDFDAFLSFLRNVLLVFPDKREIAFLLFSHLNIFKTLFSFSNPTHLAFIHSLAFFLDPENLLAFSDAIPSLLDSSFCRDPHLQEHALDCLAILSNNSDNLATIRRLFPSPSFFEHELGFARPPVFSKLLYLLTKIFTEIPSCLASASCLSRFSMVIPFADQVSLQQCLSFLSKVLDQYPHEFLESGILTLLLDTAHSSPVATVSSISIFLMSHVPLLLHLGARSDHIHSIANLFVGIIDILSDASITEALPSLSLIFSRFPDAIDGSDAFFERLLLMTGDARTADQAQVFLETHFWPYVSNAL